MRRPRTAPCGRGSAEGIAGRRHECRRGTRGRVRHMLAALVQTVREEPSQAEACATMCLLADTQSGEGCAEEWGVGWSFRVDSELTAPDGRGSKRRSSQQMWQTGQEFFRVQKEVKPDCVVWAKIWGRPALARFLGNNILDPTIAREGCLHVQSRRWTTRIRCFVPC
jgi:hypothetical protein